jgi:hypothetical protein
VLAVVAVACAWPVGAERPGAAVRTIGWTELRGPPVLEVDDPFAALPDDQFGMLQALARARVLEARGLAPTEAGRARRADLVRALATRGVDAEALLAQRDAIIALRRAAAESAVASLDGDAVEIAGYLLPVAFDGARATELLLVPAPGACSHGPLPSPNQLVRVRPARPLDVAGPYQPALVRGTMRLRIDQVTVHVVDGAVAIRSSYAIDDAIVEPVVTLAPPARELRSSKESP